MAGVGTVMAGVGTAHPHENQSGVGFPSILQLAATSREISNPDTASNPAKLSVLLGPRLERGDMFLCAGEHG